MRRPHILRSNLRNEQPQNLIFFDTETSDVYRDENSIRAKLWFGDAVFTRRQHGEWQEPEWFSFTDSDDFWQWVQTKTRSQTRLYVIAHNLAFDAAVTKMFTTLIGAGWAMSKDPVMQDPPTWFTWRRKGHTILAADNLNWFRDKLENLGTSIGYEKLEMPPDRGGEITDAWRNYCHRDVDVMRVNFIDYLAFLRTNDLGNFAMTLPAQAMGAFRHRFMHDDIFIDDDEIGLEIARKSYHGGRTETFKMGIVPDTFYVDINSMYPAVMRDELFPRRLVSVWKNITLENVRALAEIYCVSAVCHIKTTRRVYPLKAKGRCVFPIGEFTTYLSTPEIIEALNHDELVEVPQIAIYETGPLFSEYVDFFYTERLKSKDKNDLATSTRHKLFLNSLYGKFGQVAFAWNTVGDAPLNNVRTWREIDHDTGETFQMREFAGIIQQKENIQAESRDSFPAIAAHVTAYARMELWRLMQLAGTRNVLYCDTDSLFVTRAGYENLSGEMHPTELGKLKLENGPAEYFGRGLKSYIFDGKDVEKGRRKDAVQLEANLFQQTQFRGLKGMLRAGSLEDMVITQVRKRYTRKYTKGIVNLDGWVDPLVFMIKSLGLEKGKNGGQENQEKTGEKTPK